MTISTPSISRADAPTLPLLDFEAETATTVEITPEIAEAWLLLNSGNRRQGQKSFERLTTDLRNGDYRYTGDPVKFSTEGNLIDGQNRLNAIIKAQVSVKMLVVTGIEDEARDVIDTGSYFTLSQALQRHDVPNHRAVAAALTAIQAWERREHTSEPLGGASTINTSMKFLRDNPEVVRIAEESMKLATKLVTITMKQVAVLIWAFDKLDRDDRIAFFKKLSTGAGHKAGSPILQLRETLSRNAMADKSKRVGSRVILAVTIKSWNLFREGTTRNVLTFRGGGAKPEDFPIPR